MGCDGRVYVLKRLFIKYVSRGRWVLCLFMGSTLFSVPKYSGVFESKPSFGAAP